MNSTAYEAVSTEADRISAPVLNSPVKPGTGPGTRNTRANSFMTREEKAWRRMCGGKPATHKILMPKSEYLTAPPEDQSERNTDPHWQRKQQTTGGCLARMRAWGVRINEDKIQAHYDLVAAQAQRALERGTETGPQVGVAKSDLAPRVGTATCRSTPNRPVSAQPLGGPLS